MAHLASVSVGVESEQEREIKRERERERERERASERESERARSAGVPAVHVVTCYERLHLFEFGSKLVVESS